ncbi:hypothetical protein GGE09_002912 [Roseobacter sp. N2S]|nr:hypothetical protein [Roseobacter sp. N2S]
MTDTFKKLKGDILVSAGSDGPQLVGRVEALRSDTESKIAALRSGLDKANAIIRIKNSEIRELKGQVAKLNKMKFGASSDQNPDKGKETMGAKTKPTSSPGNTPPEVSKKKSDIGSENQPTQRSPTPRNRKGRGKRDWSEQIERRQIYMGTSDRKCPCGCGGSIRGYDLNETLEG